MIDARALWQRARRAANKAVAMRLLRAQQFKTMGEIFEVVKTVDLCIVLCQRLLYRARELTTVLRICSSRIQKQPPLQVGVGSQCCCFWAGAWLPARARCGS